MRDYSIKDIAAYLEEKRELSTEERRQFLEDDRKGVQTLIERWERKQEKAQRLADKYEDMSDFEHKLHTQGYQYIAGIDEAGRGPLAGPVVAAAVILNPAVKLIGVNDSKQLSRLQRRTLAVDIKNEALAIGVGLATAEEIDKINIYQASKQAMIRAVEALDIDPDYLLIDAMKLPLKIPQLALIKGDARSVSIAAASIIAKETRDAIMEDIDQRYPDYAFSDHMGYGTPAHLQAVRRLGPCPEHRLSFAPFRTG